MTDSNKSSMTTERGEIYDSIVDTIGNTPVIRLKSTFSDFKGQFMAKVEAFNPGGSSKDRIGVTMINAAENQGLLRPGGTIVEATSGNTGLGLALVGIERGYNVILVIPDKMSPEKINLVRAVGCEVVVCPVDVEPDDPRSYYSVSKRIAEETEGAFLANQYFNPANPLAHYQTTGPEIWRQTGGRITHFFAGVGTGGTISGVGKFLKQQNPDVKIIGIDPDGSILAYYHKHRENNIEARSYKVEGVGEDIIPSTVDFDVIDDFVTVTDIEAFEWTRRLAEEEGILSGGSSGLAAAGMAKYAQSHGENEMFAVVLLPDTGERYLGKAFSPSWLRANGFLPPPQSILDILEGKPANIPPVLSVDASTSIAQAVEKVKKFRVNQLVISSEDNPPMLLTKSKLYESLLSGKDKSTAVGTLMLSKLHTIDHRASLPELLYEIVNYHVVLVTDNRNWIGLLTKQDIIDNIPVDELVNL